MNIQIIQNIIMLLVIIYSPVMLSAQVHDWALSGGGKNSDNCRALYVKSNGSSIIGGYYESPATFDTTTIDALPFNGNYLASYSKAGKLEWLQVIDTRYGDIYKLKGDAEGNIYFLGSFSTDTAKFGNLIINSKKAIGTMFAYYLAKVDTQGNFEWVKTFSEDNYSNDVKDLYLDNSGNAYIIGSYVDSIRFGNNLLTATQGVNRSVFVTRFNSTGNIEWSQTIGTSTTDYLQYLSISGYEENIIAGGYLGGESIIDSNTYSNEYFRTEININGKITNTVNNGGINTQCDAFGNVYYLRNDSLFKTNFNGQLVYGESTLPVARNLVVSSDGSVIVSREDVYDTNTDRALTAKHNRSGELVWITTGKGQIELAGIGLDSLGNLYYGGSFMSQTASLGSKELINKGVNNYQRDMFLAKITNPEIESIEIKDSSGIPVAALNNQFLLNPGIVDINKFYLSPAGNLENTEIQWYINDEPINYTPDGTKKSCKNCRTQSEINFPWPAEDGNYKLTAKPIWKKDSLKVEGAAFHLDFTIKNSSNDVIEKVTINTKDKQLTKLEKHNEVLLSDIDSSSVLNLYMNLFATNNFEIKIDGKIIDAKNDSVGNFNNSTITFPALNLKEPGQHIITVVLKGLDGAVDIKQEFEISVQEANDKLTSIQISEKGTNLVFPNPFQSQIQISLTDMKGLIDISLSDLSGKVYFTGESMLSDGAASLDLENSKLKPGTYLLKVSQEGKNVAYEKIVKM